MQKKIALRWRSLLADVRRSPTLMRLVVMVNVISL